MENTNRNLDDINASLRQSQKHINGIKSIFGGLKNYFSGNNNKLQGQPISEVPGTSKAPSSTPTNNTSSSSSETFKQEKSLATSTSYNEPPATFQKKAPATTNTFEARLESNLDAMCDNLSRLKGLAVDLHGEIESQNDLIDEMVYKSEIVEGKIGKQQKDIDRLLKK